MLFGIAVTSLFSVQPAQALGFTDILQQVGANVVATGSGAIDLAGLAFGGAVGGPVGVEANIGYIATGPTGLGDIYSGYTGPANFGTGGGFFANFSSGDNVGISAFQNLLLVPTGYVSNTALSSSATWLNQTLSGMGLTPGTYVWTWGDGGANERFTLVIGAVPDGGTTISLLGCALLGLAVLRRKLGC